MNTAWDVIVIGGGNAALCAAVAAAERGARTLVLERASRADRGGNSAYTAGAMRVAYEHEGDIRRLVPDLSDDDRATSDFGTYGAEEFLNDMRTVTNGRTDPEMSAALVQRSLPTLLWMQGHGVRFTPLYHRQSYLVDGVRRFWGGLTFGAEGAGPGLVDRLHDAAAALGVEVWYGARAIGLRSRGRVVDAVVVERDDAVEEVRCSAAIIASGGFESSTEMRTRYLGPGWDMAKVRGTHHNTGDGIRMALDAGAMSWGQYSGAHAVFWDRDTAQFGNLDISNEHSKLSYPLGIIVNLAGQRFVDEGADFRNYTYAKYGREILKQPGQQAWQLYDAKVVSMLQKDYDTPAVTKVEAETLEELADLMEGVDKGALLATIETFNDSIDTARPFDPTRKDGRAARSVTPPKSNWANALDTPPYVAFAVTVGITFTFGGVRIEPDTARVVTSSGDPFHNLFAAGEIVGGLFFDNYPGGAGLTAGSVFGRIAGATAGALVGTREVTT